MLELIKQYAQTEFNANDDAGVLAILNAKTVSKTNSELQTTRAIRLVLGEADAITAIGGLKTAGAANPLMDSMYLTVSTTGLDFSSDETQAAIDALTAVPVWTTAVGDKLKALGIWSISPSQDRFQRDAVQADVDQARQQTALDEVYIKSNSANEAAEASFRNGDTPAQITAAGQSGWDA